MKNWEILSPMKLSCLSRKPKALRTSFRGFLGALFVLALLPLTALAEASDVRPELEIPPNILLLFPDRTLLLNFRTQPELLTQKPVYSLNIGQNTLPISGKELLLKDSEYLDIQMEFKTIVSPDNLHDFFVASSVFQAKESAPIEINIEEKTDTITFEGKPYDGFDVDEAKLVTLINRAIETGEKNIRVPAKKIFSKVVVHPDLKKKGIAEVLAVGKSNFSGSSDARRQNIRAGAKKFNGATVKKGRTFSFNNILESVEEEDGFVREMVIKGNENKKELGGGVCQVSTTAFRAAFTGGLPITERRNHSYSVPYYKPFGLDAAIYLGVSDLRFRNDTPGDLLIQTFIEEDDLYFVFYGTRDKRQISFEGPFISHYREAPETQIFETEDLPNGETKMVSNAHAGFRTEWIRRVKSEEGETDEQSLVSNYRPWPAKILKGIGKKDNEKTEAAS